MCLINKTAGKKKKKKRMCLLGRTCIEQLQEAVEEV